MYINVYVYMYTYIDVVYIRLGGFYSSSSPVVVGRGLNLETFTPFPEFRLIVRVMDNGNRLRLVYIITKVRLLSLLYVCIDI